MIKYLLSIVVLTTSLFSSELKRVLILPGKHSHGVGEHEFQKGGELLEQSLRASGVPLEIKTFTSWSEEIERATWDTVVLYSDGLEDEVVLAHEGWLQKHLASGKGLVVLHFALEPSAQTSIAMLWDEFLGGRFEVDWSVNPIWTLEKPILAHHPVTQGVCFSAIQDEWYYHLRFTSPVIPILSGVPPFNSLGADGSRSGNATVRREVEQGTVQTLAWVLENRAKGKVFGFTGGHFHRNWYDEGFRKLILNAIVWTAGLSVPSEGVASVLSIENLYPTMDDAIIADDLEGVKALIKRHPDWMNRGKTEGLPPLHHAILRKKSAIAAYLIEAGADLNQLNSSQQTPLHLCVERDLSGLIPSLLAKKENPNLLDRNGWTPLHLAAAKDRVKAARALLDGGADLHVLSEGGGTPLHEAAASGGEEMVQLLLDHGVDRTVRSKSGVTALSIAQERGNQAALKWLK